MVDGEQFMTWGLVALLALVGFCCSGLQLRRVHRSVEDLRWAMAMTDERLRRMKDE